MLGLSVGLLATALTLFLWSLWWPHRDMRQIWATGVGTVSAVLGIVLLSRGAVRRPAGRTRRSAVTLCVIGTGVLGVPGYALLRSASEHLR